MEYLRGKLISTTVFLIERDADTTDIWGEWEVGELEASKSNIKEIQYPSLNEEGDFLEWWVNAVKGPKSQRQPHSRYTVKFVSLDNLLT